MCAPWSPYMLNKSLINPPNIRFSSSAVLYRSFRMSMAFTNGAWRMQKSIHVRIGVFGDFITIILFLLDFNCFWVVFGVELRCLAVITTLLIQSNDPVLNKTHVIGDTVQFETYPDSCIFLGTKQTTPIDNGAQREYEAEFGVSRTRSSEHPPWHFISNFIIKSKEIIFASPSVFYHGNGSRISSRHKVGITHCQHPYISHLLSTKTSQMFDEKILKIYWWQE